MVFLVGGLVIGAFVGASVEPRLAPGPGHAPPGVVFLASLLLWTAALGAGMGLGVGLALALATPVLDLLSRRGGGLARGGARHREAGPALPGVGFPPGARLL